MLVAWEQVKEQQVLLHALPRDYHCHDILSIIPVIRFAFLLSYHFFSSLSLQLIIMTLLLVQFVVVLIKQMLQDDYTS